MRISDWSSDVCSSDLPKEFASIPRICPGYGLITRNPEVVGSGEGDLVKRSPEPTIIGIRRVCHPEISSPLPASRYRRRSGDRKSVVSGKRVSVRVDLGGRRIIKKKSNTQTKKY